MEYTLKDLLDISGLRELLDSFNEIHNMPSAIVDIEGTVLTATGWQDICTKFHRLNPETKNKCIESDVHLSAELGNKTSQVVHRCPMGLVDSATPIIIEGKHLGSVFTGQLFIEAPDEAWFIEQANRYGFDESEYLSAMRKVPCISEEHLKRNLTFIHSLAHMLAEQGLRQKRLLVAQEALRRSEQNFRSIIDASPAPLGINDDLGNITFVNKAFVHSFGYTINDIPTLAVWWPTAYPDPEYRQWLVDSWQKNLDEAKRTGRPFASIEARVRCKDGSVRTVLCSASPIEENFAGNHLVILYDITEREQAEQKLYHSHELMRYIIEHNRSAIAVHDRDLNYIYVSQRYLQDYGVMEKDIIGKHHYDVFPDLPQKWRDVHRRALAGEVSSAENDPYPREDGSVDWTRWECRPWYDADGQIGGIIVYTEVITERKRVEEELRLSKERLEAMINAIPDLMFRTDRDGCIYEYYSTVPEPTHVQPEAFLGKRFPEIVPEEPSRIIMAALAEAAEKGSHRGAVYRLQTPSGEKWYELSIEAMGAPDQPSAQFIMLAHDMTKRRLVEKQLKSSEENYRNISGLTSDFVYKCTRTGTTPFRIQWAGGGVRSISGYNAEEIYEAGCWLPFVHPDDRQTLTSHLYSLIPGDRKSIEFRLITKQGDTRWISETSSCIAGENEGELILFGAARDITERKGFEEALQMTRVSVEAASDSIFWLMPDGRIVDVNPAACHSLGYTREEMLGLIVQDVDPRCNTEVWQRHFSELRQRGSINIESEQRAKDGRLIPVEISANYVQFGTEERNCAFVRDITDRKHAEEALLKSERRLKDVIDFLPDATLAIDNEKKVIVWNKAIERMTGVKAEEMIGKGNYEYTLPFYGERRHQLMDLILESEQDIAEKYSHLQREGSSLTAEAFCDAVYERRGAHIFMKASPLHDQEGCVIGAIESIRDITKQKLADEEREKLQAQLFQAQKMESVGRLAGGVAHDFNNMLSVILGHAELALMKLEPTQPIVPHLLEIHAAAERSADLTRQLLAFARKQTIAPKVLDLNESVEGMLRMLQRLIGEDLDLAWMPGTGVWPVKMDPSQLDQIMANLCVNARDAIAGEGKITLETANADFDECYCSTHRGFIPGKFVLLAVSDDGCGMDEETQENIFDPFFTTKEMGKGTGLGLATVYGIVTQNKGFINVYSEPGHGTTFKIYIPRHADKDLELKEHAQIPAAGGHETILLVEDEPEILAMGKAMLESFGYSVLAASTPDKALRLAKEHTGEIPLLLTDVVMPKMNGRDLAQSLQTLYPGLICMFMSGYTSDVITHRGVLDEGVHFIQKPFSMQSLAAKVRGALDEKQQKR